jgi:hypothetical protein
MKMKTYKYNDYEILPLSEKEVEENLADFALMERSDLTEEELAQTFARTTVEQIREYVSAGMPCNPDDGTFDFDTCNRWWVENILYPNGHSMLECAKDYLREMLEDGARPAKEIYERGTSKNYGFSDRTIDRAKSKLGIVSRKVGKHFIWELPTP